MRVPFGCALGVGAWLALGCAVGPDYERPVLSVPEKWRTEANAQADATLANVPWWELFKDEQLQALIQVALAQNQDLKIAVERIDTARLQSLQTYTAALSPGQRDRLSAALADLPHLSPRSPE